MKKLVVILLLVAAVGLVALAFGGGEEPAQSYLRIHIRANSNGADDQAVKYAVRDGIVAYLAPVIAECGSKREALAAVRARTAGIEQTAARILREEGYSYGARAEVRREQFPTRVYDGVTLAAGEYDALIVELGTGEGDNWWCVVYPPLCFTGGNVDVAYRSRIYEIIRSFFGEEE